MVNLSVNINKIATLRNSRGGDVPSVLKAAERAESYGAQGITVHPRPDERHIKYRDIRELQPAVKTEFNIEGNPVDKFIDLVLKNPPAQVTLVPDDENALTSDSGWDTVKYRDYLSEIIARFKAEGIRTSIFVDPSVEMVKGAGDTGTDRIELYTESYARDYAADREKAIQPYRQCAEVAADLGLGINAGHDLSLDNIAFFKNNIPELREVSIGHALIAESVYSGMETVVKRYLELLK